jgi:hypothetical protein
MKKLKVIITIVFPILFVASHLIAYNVFNLPDNSFKNEFQKSISIIYSSTLILTPLLFIMGIGIFTCFLMIKEMKYQKTINSIMVVFSTLMFIHILLRLCIAL